MLTAAMLAACSFDPGATGILLEDGAPAIDAERTSIDAAPDAVAVDADSDAAPSFVDPTPMAGIIFALPKNGITVDGVLDEWQDFSWVSIAAPNDYVQLAGSTGAADDISAKLAVRWEASRLYLAILVTDNSYQNSASDDLLWQGDSVQVAFDMAKNGGGAYDSTDDFEFGWARSAGDALDSYRWMAPSNQAAYVVEPYEVIRNGTSTAYELSLTPADLGLEGFSAATGDVGISWMVNEADGSGREGFIEWSSGIAQGKNPGLFGILRFYPTGP